MIVCVCGGRHYSNRAALFRALDAIHEATPITLVAQGYCTIWDQEQRRYVPSGADKLAMDWANSHGVIHTGFRYRADWARFGRSAGPRRNGAMLRETCPHLVLACPGGAGTADCVRQAEALGVRVERVPAG